MTNATYNTNTDEEVDLDVLTSTEDPCHLVVWNDEINTFEWVIETLIKNLRTYPGAGRTMCHHH